MEKNSSYNWKYTRIGGVTRVSIETGDDIIHLPELDQKQWTVLSCPTTGLEMDPETLKMLDSDGDGHIKVNEVTSAIKWLNNVVKTPANLLNKSDVMPFSDFRDDTDEGKKLLSSAKQILANLKLDKQEISIADTTDSVKIFADTKFNGDGIITEASADDDNLKQIIKHIISTIGKSTDRSGADGVAKENIEDFYKEAAEYTEWKKQATGDTSIIPYGDKTAAARDAYNAIKEKVADYFIRCKLVALDDGTSTALEIPKEELAKLSGKNLAEAIDNIAGYPLARISQKAQLPLNEPVNPAWEAKFSAFKSLIADVDFAGKTSLSESEWNTIGAKFDSYDKWLAAKKGAKVESVGYDNLVAIVDGNRKDDLLALVTKDLAEKDNAESIQAVNKLLHFYRDIYVFVRNFVTFSDFYLQYKNDQKAIFQAGTLYIDQRSCDLCIKVSDMAKHNATAPQSAMFIIYCDCENKQKGQKMTIAAVVTDGSVDNISVGKNGVFYDRAGLDWNATVTKVVENPISIREAFWSPYKKTAKFIEDQVTKFASSKDAEITANAESKVAETSTNITSVKPAEGDAAAVDAAAATKKDVQPFDIAKFCGVFAAIGLALGYIGGFLLSLGKGFIALPWWGMILSILALMLIISGPAMLMAYLKLRRRNLSPLLNANGWAVNAHAYVNITFGATLTKLAKFPFLRISSDPMADKGTPKWKIVLWILAILALIFGILYLNGKLDIIGLPFNGFDSFKK